MAIGEIQLNTWASIGSVQQSAATYQSIKGVLNDTSSPYRVRSFENFLQGSYGNDTNVWRDSDVDIVMRLSSVYYSDTSGLNPADKSNYDRNFSRAEYSFALFKQEVASWLTRSFGRGVDASGKAIFVPGSGSRRDADVLACAEHREYITYPASGQPVYREGIVFWKADGGQIINYPKQHSANCTDKHQATGGYFKPTVRIFKNIRNRMVEDGWLKQGGAPSYFLEGMLYNVPTNLYGTSYQQTVINCFNHIYEMEDKSRLTCANGIHWLIRPGHSVCWSPDQHTVFMEAFKQYWNAF
ncbi:nucleotidyltransferase [Rhizobium leguminosarum bv. trifolii]|uniref:nucleotidyltransferase domain-containing protein n=1 Tax=Rhizobium leguminosarum TaxID=384 RepID=UPI00140F5A4C|nr:nucleotidyltransferase [Rhizobium leguminosarum]QIO70600.1 nucleotidyltransferase [Rhizobium leguminosarum bv. trifolii]QIO77605.1 nucleotidyltransferase [Rhizobium leguminosarum bv. trifolii]